MVSESLASFLAHCMSHWKVPARQTVKRREVSALPQLGRKAQFEVESMSSILQLNENDFAISGGIEQFSIDTQ